MEGTRRRKRQAGFTMLEILVVLAIIGLAAIALTIFLCYRFADRMVSVLGPSGINVMVRLSAFILLCIGIEIMWTGWAELNSIKP